MPGCSVEFTADNKDALRKQGMEHAKTHGMAAMAPDPYGGMVSPL